MLTPCIAFRVALHLADGVYELYPAPEDEVAAELPPPEAEAVQAEEQLPSSSFEGKPRSMNPSFPNLRMPSASRLCIYVKELFATLDA